MTEPGGRIGTVVGVRHERHDSGFTRVELLAAMLIVGILTGIAVGFFKTWSRSQQEIGTAQEVTSALRNADERALSEDVAYCVDFQGTSYTVYKVPGADYGTPPASC